MKLSAAKAAQEVGKSTATITRAIEKGKISASKDENGAWAIDPAELFRVFAPAKPENPSMQRNAKPNETGDNRGLDRLVETLQQELERLRAERDAQVADLREDRDAWKADAAKWQEQAAQALRLLPPPVVVSPADAPAAAPPVVAERPRRSWWSWGRAND